MNRFLRLFVFLLLFILSPRALFAQTITADDTAGCAPHSVNFTASGGTTYSWDFGNGMFAGNVTAATIPYSNPGTYTVICTIDGVPKTLQIYVYPNPIAGFEASPPLSGCTGLVVRFTDTSFGGGGTNIVSWKWDFGDGGSNNVSGNPSYQYNLPGSFSVGLIVNDANGCTGTVTTNDYIHVSVPPSVSATANPPTACFAPLDVIFTSTASPGAGATSLTYQWSFGNGDSSNTSADTVTYDTAGVFPVVLVVTDNNNCSKTFNTSVSINNPIASFSVINDTLCKTVTFTNLSTTALYQWNFGDGNSTVPGAGTAFINGVSNTSGTYNTPTHTYANPLPYNPYNVTLTVTNTIGSQTCSDDTTITIYIDGVHASFTSAPHYSCSMPFVVDYDGTGSTNAAQWSWTFVNDTSYLSGPTNTATGPTPKDTIITLDTNRYTIHWDEMFDVYLMITSPHGCTDDTTIARNDTVYKPTALFMPDTVSGCFPLTVTFYDSSKSVETINNWEWIFGDGSDSSGGNAIDTIAHTYTSTGDFEASLVITNALGCIDTSYTIIIEVGKPPVPDFSASPLQVCTGDSVQFTDLTPLSDSVDVWHYVTDGNRMWSCPKDPNPSWAYSSDVGFFDVTLTVGYNGCFADTTITNMVEVLGPIGRFRYVSDCDSPFVYSFISESKGYTELDWNFGDGNSLLQTTNGNPSHTYASTGDYSVILTAYNSSSGCPPSSDTIIVRVRNIKAMIGQDSLFCSGVPATLNASGSIDVYNYCHRGYSWDFGDSTRPIRTDNPIVDHAFNTQGFVNIRLVVSDTNGCTDTAYKSILIHKIVAGFVMDTTVGYFGIDDTLLACVPSTIQFTDSTVADTGLASWVWVSTSWNLAQNIPTGAYFNSSSLQNDTFTYNNYLTGLYMIGLVVTDSLGCVDSIKKFIRISSPDSSFYTVPNTPDSREICVGADIDFQANNTNPGTQYLWDFGEGGSDSIVNPVHVYDTAGDFNVTLIVTDSVGCTAQETYSGYIHVQKYPQAGFYITALDENENEIIVDTATIVCYPQQPEFHDTSYYNAPYIDDWDWNLGTGSPVINDSVVTRNCNNPAVYPVSLIVTTTFGCKDTAYASLSLVGPIADFSVTDTLICRDDSIMFILQDTTDVFAFQWFFGDGYSDSTGTDSVYHTYDYHPDGGQTLATLRYWSADSTCRKDTAHVIKIWEVIADFDITDNDNNGVDTSHCLGFGNTFINQSQMADSWKWNFGDGSTSTGGGNQSHTYTTADTFDVELDIEDIQTGCVDTMIKQLIVYQLPTATATGNDTCAGDSIQINASGGLTYAWNPSSGLSNSSDSMPMAGPSSSTIYTVTVTDENGCEDTDTAAVIIYQKPPELHLDTTIIIGEEVPMNFSQGSDYTYQWTPNTNWLSCTDCPDPTAKPLENILYELVVTDKIDCFTVTSSYDIIVEPKTSVDVPDAFTPEATVNNIVYVKGWGIKSLLEFKIYNRWGQLVYENPGDIKQGWDGTYQGKIQNMDTYVYYVKVETYLENEPKSISGHLLLIR